MSKTLPLHLTLQMVWSQNRNFWIPVPFLSQSHTSIAHTFEDNNSKIEDAIESAVYTNKPYGILGYSQGFTNGLFCKSLLQSATPLQQSRLVSPSNNLVCRQFLCDAANGSMHGPVMEEKHNFWLWCVSYFSNVNKVISVEHSLLLFLKLSLMSWVLLLYQKFVAGEDGTFLHNGSRAF